MSEDRAVCELCGEPMPPGEEMFKFHGYSGPCPKPPLPRTQSGADLIAAGRQLETDSAEWWRQVAQGLGVEIARLRTLAKEATNGWACFARTKREHDEIDRLHQAIDSIPNPPAASAPAPAEPPQTRCDGCGYQWPGPWPPAHLCGDCWRKAQPVLHGPATEREAVRVLEEAARRFLVGYAREVTARTQWATQSDPYTEESRRMFDTVMNREAETRDLAMALGRIVYPEETAALRAESEGGGRG